MRRRPAALAASALVAVAVLAAAAPVAAEPAPARAPADEPTLVARATLSADFVAPGPPSGALATPANGRVGPFPGPGHPRVLGDDRQR